MSKTLVIFFDSHGNPWATCHPNHKGAEAFGPRGAAIPAPGPSFKEADTLGLIDRGEDGDFPVLIPPDGMFEEMAKLARREDQVNDPCEHDQIAWDRGNILDSAGIFPARWAWEARLID
jgi:hypothetical protein